MITFINILEYDFIDDIFKNFTIIELIKFIFISKKFHTCIEQYVKTQAKLFDIQDSDFFTTTFLLNSLQDEINKKYEIRACIEGYHNKNISYDIFISLLEQGLIDVVKKYHCKNFLQDFIDRRDCYTHKMPIESIKYIANLLFDILTNEEIRNKYKIKKLKYLKDGIHKGIITSIEHCYNNILAIELRKLSLLFSDIKIEESDDIYHIPSCKYHKHNRISDFLRSPNNKTVKKFIRNLDCCFCGHIKNWFKFMTLKHLNLCFKRNIVKNDADSLLKLLKYSDLQLIKQLENYSFLNDFDISPLFSDGYFLLYDFLISKCTIKLWEDCYIIINFTINELIMFLKYNPHEIELVLCLISGACVDCENHVTFSLKHVQIYAKFIINKFDVNIEKFLSVLDTCTFRNPCEINNLLVVQSLLIDKYQNIYFEAVNKHIKKQIDIKLKKPIMNDVDSESESDNSC